MDQVLILDTETTGLSPETDRCIEVGAVRYSLTHHCVIESMSRLISAEGNAAERINHIPAAALKNVGIRTDATWEQVDRMAWHCDAILAHRAEFDQQWIPEAETGTPNLHLKPWICTKFGVRWPLQAEEGQSLIYLALEHGVAVADPHRALADCMLLARLLYRCHELGHDVQAMLARGLRPMATFQALVSFDDKDKAKDAGFRWDAAKRQWLRKMAIADAAELPFKTRQV
jgi:DNA polymerase-3 subunit epsilon